MSSRRGIGILAYGSLLADPREEIAAVTVGRVAVTTPFCVEYARSSQRRAGAPTLVPVPEDLGAPVMAQILLVQPGLGQTTVSDILFRREIGCVGDLSVKYQDDVQRAGKNAVVIEVLEDLAGVPMVLYASLEANIPEILRGDLILTAKAEVLAKLAIASVTAKTYRAGRDGLRYLADAISHEIHTPLTDLYRDTVLRLTGGAPNLEVARTWIAQQRQLALENQHD